MFLLPIGRPIPVFESGRIYIDTLDPIVSPPVISVLLKPHIYTCSQKQKQWQQIQKEKSIVVEAHVDGSFFVERGIVRAGAGVYFGDGDEHNRCVLVPHKSPFPMDSLRSELYASLLCAHLSIFEKYMSCHSKLVIFQDSVVAMHLLRACKYGSCLELLTMSPGKWAREGAKCSSGKNQFEINYLWGERSDASKILKYADILDLWWLTTMNRSVEIRWVNAHQQEPANKTSIEYHHWKGNHLADTFAKLGARSDRTDVLAMEPFMNYPLYRADLSIKLPPKRNPKLDYLPLFPELSDQLSVKLHLSTGLSTTS